MNSSAIVQKYLNFFKNRKHQIIPSASLIPENDPTTLFITAGMQPLIPYLLGLAHPLGKRLINSQKCFRSQDIEEVGDNRHTTFFEMLGNWSLGDYFKKEQLPWLWEFLTQELKLPPRKLYIGVFAGSDSVPKDEESINIWKKIGIPAEKIFFYGVKKNWWSPSGTPEQMQLGEIGGPDSEVFYDFGAELKFHENSPFKEQKCHPNCDCGRFLEICNSVFIQYQKQADGSLKEMEQRNVDFGGGLERLTAAVNNEPDVFKSDLFKDTIKAIEEMTNKKYQDKVNKPTMRVIADHVKAAVFLICDGVLPFNKTQGYILRRLLRKSAVKILTLGGGNRLPAFSSICDSVLRTYKGRYFDKFKDIEQIKKTIQDEINKFADSLDRGLKEMQKIEKIDAQKAFYLYQSYGFPLEITSEIFTQKGQKIDKSTFAKEFKKHQELSRATSSNMFKKGKSPDKNT